MVDSEWYRAGIYFAGGMIVATILLFSITFACLGPLNGCFGIGGPPEPRGVLRASVVSEEVAPPEADVQHISATDIPESSPIRRATRKAVEKSNTSCACENATTIARVEVSVGDEIASTEQQLGAIPTVSPSRASGYASHFVRYGGKIVQIELLIY